MSIYALKNTNLELCLDFTNTMDWHASDHSEETLLTYPDLVAWSREAGLVSEDEAEALLSTAEEQPVEAHRALENARLLREATYRIFVAVTKGHPPSEDNLAHLNQALTDAMRGARIERSPGGFTWNWENTAGDLEAPLRPIARSAAALLTSDMLARVGQCADDRGCGYLFLDTSKNHSRRWCNMGGCGNRAKQRRYYRRNMPAQG